jgi:flagellar hook-length control protein FliK
MADSNSLVLLPPRPTAQPLQDPNATKSTRPSDTSDDESFKNKLEKAKKLKAHVPVKKQIVQSPPKPAGAKPTTEASDKTAAAPDPAKKPGKPVQTPDDQLVVTEEKAQTKQPDAQTLPVAEDAVEQLVNKKPAKISKPAGIKSTDPVVPKITAAIQTPVTASAGPSKDVSANAKGVVTPVAIDQGDPSADGNAPGAGGPATASPTAEFGTGKVVTSVKGDPKNASGDQSAAGDASAEGASSAASAAAIAVPGFVDAAAPPDAPAVRLSTQAESPVGDISSAAAGLVSSPTGTAVTNIAGKSAPVVTPQARFVEDNQPKIISSIQGQLMPHGGTMQLRLDPPELGALSVTVHMHDGVMTASFETSNADATKMLSHSLGQLKAGLEAAGVSVDKIHVEQGSKGDAQGDGDPDSKQPAQEQQQQAQQDQQRREMVQRMWRKLAGGDPLDLVA